MTLWSSTLEKLLSFSINLFARQLYSPQSSHLDTVPLWSPTNLCKCHLPSTKVDDLAMGSQVYPCHTEQICKEQCRGTGVSRCHQRLFPRPLSSYICLHEPRHVQNSCSKWSLWVLKWYRDQGKDHVRSNVQAAAATFSNLDWKTKR